MNKKIVVMNENVLGIIYAHDEHTIHVLRSYRKDAPNIYELPVVGNIREATQTDFDHFRVSSKGFLS